MRARFLAALASGGVIGLTISSCGGIVEDDRRLDADASTNGSGGGGKGGSGAKGGSGGGGGVGGPSGYGGGPVDGRPFVVNGDARTASVVERNDWLSSSLPEKTVGCDATTREMLAGAWLAAARDEHASIASFARFTLELLALGAPPSFVQAAQRASLDEIEHARLCFALASRFGARNVGPGVLAVADSGRDHSLAEAAAAAFREGCIGESVAAALAHARLERAGDPDVRAALRRIARDEKRHAELAWRFVGWAVALCGGDLQSAIARELTTQSHTHQASAGPRPGTGRASFEYYGLLTQSDADRVVREIFDQVVVPCANALLAVRVAV